MAKTDSNPNPSLNSYRTFISSYRTFKYTYRTIEMLIAQLRKYIIVIAHLG